MEAKEARTNKFSRKIVFKGDKELFRHENRHNRYYCCSMCSGHGYGEEKAAETKFVKNQLKKSLKKSSAVGFSELLY